MPHLTFIDGIFMNFSKSSLCLAILTSIATFSTQAQTSNNDITNTNKIETITVTSDFRQQSLLKAPISMSVLTDIEIHNAVLTTLKSLLQLART